LEDYIDELFDLYEELLADGSLPALLEAANVYDELVSLGVLETDERFN
jgi:hypothetical protein